MIPPVKPGAVLGKFHGPIIETERLILRPWRSSDIASNTRMLSDPGTARFITRDRKAVAANAKRRIARIQSASTRRALNAKSS